MKYFLKDLKGLSIGVLLAFLSFGLAKVTLNKYFKSRETVIELNVVNNHIKNEDILNPVLTKEVYAVVGQEFEIYYEGILLAKNPKLYNFQIYSDTIKGITSKRKWSINPSMKDVGHHQLIIDIRTLDNKLISSFNTKLIINTPEKEKRNLNILIVGASNVEQSHYPNLLWTKLSNWPSAESIRFIGNSNLKPYYKENKLYSKPLEEVKHEGYGGWGWNLFLTHYNPGREDKYKLSSSPFVFLNKGKPELDVEKYLTNKNALNSLDFIIFDLGVNETFTFNPDSETIEQEINKVLDHAEDLIGSFKNINPDSKLIILIPQPFTRDKDIFLSVYKKFGTFIADPWRHRKVIYNLGYIMNKRFNDEDNKIILLPMNLYFDSKKGYYSSDPGHPNIIGANQITNSIFSAIVNFSN